MDANQGETQLSQSATASQGPTYVTSPRNDSGSTSSREWAMVAHLAAFGAFVLPLGHLIGPLIVYLVRKDHDPRTRSHAAASLSFQITMTLVFLVFGGAGVFFALALGLGTLVNLTSAETFTLANVPWVAISALILMGFVALALFVADLVLIVVNAIRAFDGKEPTYWPMIRFVT